MSSESLTIKVLKYLMENPGATIKDIAQGLSISLGLARAVIYRLKNKGFIEKTGYGYILTSIGEKIVEKQLKRTKEEREEVQQRMVKEEEIGERRVVEKTSKTPTTTIETTKTLGYTSTEMESLVERVRTIEKTIAGIEETIASLKKELAIIKKALEEKLREKKKSVKKHVSRLPKPIMSIIEAQNILGDEARMLVYSGKAVAVGSLLVDIDYYREFLSKFPISVKEAEKMSEQEKLLLEELKNEGRVYLYCGKEYRLV